jgi:hypothetical protein
VLREQTPVGQRQAIRGFELDPLTLGDDEGVTVDRLRSADPNRDSWVLCTLVELVVKKRPPK